MLEVLYHHAKFGGVRISPTTEAAKNVEVFYVCLSVHHANSPLLTLQVTHTFPHIINQTPPLLG